MVTTALAWLWTLTTDLFRPPSDPCPECRQPRTSTIPQWEAIVLAATWWAYPFGPWTWPTSQPQCANPSCTPAPTP